jgi:hypothetical protein
MNMLSAKAEIEEGREASGTPFWVSDSGVVGGGGPGEEVVLEGRGAEGGGGGIGGFNRGSVLTAYAAPKP